MGIGRLQKHINVSDEITAGTAFIKG